MPGGPRIDAPGVLYQVMVRGLECRAIFGDDRDRAGFVRRLAALVGRRALPRAGTAAVRGCFGRTCRAAGPACAP